MFFLSYIAITLSYGSSLSEALIVDPDSLSILDIQFRGTHNSYYKRRDSNVYPFTAYDFTEYPLSVQLDNGIRAVEIDIDPCDFGGFRDAISGACTDYPVQHVTVFDTQVTCDTLRECVGEVATWSYKYRGYFLPLFIKIELKNVELTGSWDDYDDILDAFNIVDDIFEQVYGSPECNPIVRFKEDYVENFGASWADTTLGQLRGRVIVLSTNGNSNYVLNNFVTTGLAGDTTNGWPDDLGQVLFATCNPRHARENFDNEDYCAIVSVSDASNAPEVESFNKYIILSNFDSGFYQIEGYTFDLDSTGIPTSITVEDPDGSSTTFNNYNTWQGTEQFLNIDLSRRTTSIDSSGLTSIKQCLDDSISPRSDALDNVLYDCEIIEFVVYNLGPNSAAALFGALPFVKDALGIATDYIANVQQFLAVFTSLQFEYSIWRFDADTEFQNATQALNSGLNLLMTDYPFGTPNIANEYSFSLTLTCNLTAQQAADLDLFDAPARSKDFCFVFAPVQPTVGPTEEPTREPTEEPTEEPTDGPGPLVTDHDFMDDFDDNEFECSFGYPIDQIVDVFS